VVSFYRNDFTGAGNHFGNPKNINDDFSGSGPDIGAFEFQCVTDFGSDLDVDGVDLLWFINHFDTDCIKTMASTFGDG